MASRSSISSSSVHGRLSRCPAWSMVAMCMISRSGVGGRLGRVRTVGREGGRYSEFEEREPLSAQPVSIWLKRDCQRHQASWKFECDGIGGACPARGPYIHASIIRRVPGRRTPPISQIRFCPSFNDLPKRGAATRGGRSQSYRVCARYEKCTFGITYVEAQHKATINILSPSNTTSAHTHTSPSTPYRRTTMRRHLLLPGSQLPSRLV
jgi:hypothetical protein